VIAKNVRFMCFLLEVLDVEFRFLVACRNGGNTVMVSRLGLISAAC
jgi:hypothetical protein